MTNVVALNTRRACTVDHVSVQVVPHEQANGSFIYVVEVLFTDDTWTSAAFSRDPKLAKEMARKEAQARGARLLDQHIWPTHPQIG